MVSVQRRSLECGFEFCVLQGSRQSCNRDSEWHRAFRRAALPPAVLLALLARSLCRRSFQTGCTPPQPGLQNT